MKKKIIVANWKMNYDLHKTTTFLRNFIKFVFDRKIIHNKEIIIAPSFPFLHISNQISQGTSLKIAAQNIYSMDKGSYTGEVSALMIKSIGINRVIIGHSERKKFFLEKDDFLLEKVKTAIKNRIKVIFCVGETIDDRNKNNHFISIESQLKKTIFNCSLDEIRFLYIAYEPVWSIGTGLTASDDQIQKMHSFIRYKFSCKYNKYISEQLPILYGGSINDLNSKKIFSNKDVDGGLIGKCSLDIEKFIKIIQS
ncbi:triose-phosphate isomerase [Blattabacterium cuenoti]|uniref:triose-phosphate isomerase n=1 Tax=Blattabacterium cuenoti TaxID=1653831 RepID=UPI00163B9C8F|nr:triose-phosphate isomerase [Blattabacterium cuenoti]